MASHERIHVAGGLYYVIHYRPQGICSLASPDDSPALRSLVGEALNHHKLRAYGFFIHPGADYLHYIVRIADKSVSRLVSSIETRRASAFGSSCCGGRRVFVRHSIRLLEQRYLALAVRYLHLLPVRLRLAHSPDAYPWSSERAYRGIEHYDWLNVHAAWHLWPVDASTAQRIYRERAPAPLDPDDVHLIEHGSELDSRVIGSPEFIRSLPASYLLANRMTLCELCDAVGAGFGVRPDEIRSHSHRHILVVARAFLNDYATRRAGHKKNEVAKYLRHSEVDLAVTLKRCRKMHPELFTVQSIPEDGSLRQFVK